MRVRDVMRYREFSDKRVSEKAMLHVGMEEISAPLSWHLIRWCRILLQSRELERALLLCFTRRSGHGTVMLRFQRTHYFLARCLSCSLRGCRRFTKLGVPGAKPRFCEVSASVTLRAHGTISARGRGPSWFSARAAAADRMRCDLEGIRNRRFGQ